MSLQAVLGLAICALAGAASTAAEVISVEGGTVHTLSARGTLEHATVLIENGRISAVGEDVEVPPGARRIDARGKVVTPGLFDPYSYIGVVEIDLVEETVDVRQTGERYTASFEVATAINPRSTLIPVNRVEGLTRAAVVPHPGTVTPETPASVLLGHAAVLHLGGVQDYLVEPRAALFAALGEAGAALAGGSRASAIARLREALEDAADYAEHRTDYERGARRDYALSRPDLEALQPVLTGRVPIAVMADRASDIEAALDLAAAHELDLVIVGGAEGWMVAERLADARVPVIIDPLENLPQRFETVGASAENAARLHAAGVTVAIGTSDSHNARNLTQAAGNAVAHGLPWEAGLAAITRNPAEIYAQSERSGTLEPGKEADVVVWSGDPLEVTTFADHVIIRGRETLMESRQTLLRDRYLESGDELPPAYRHPGQSR